MIKEPSNNNNNNTNINSDSLPSKIIIKNMRNFYINTNNDNINSSRSNEEDNNSETYADSVPPSPSFPSSSSSPNHSVTNNFSFLVSSDNNKARILLITEILENILIFIPEPNDLALVCRQFYNIVLTSPIFKRRWLRNWLNPKLPDAFLPKYSDLCRAIKTKTPFHILVQIIDLIKIHEKPLASSNNGSVTKLFEYANQHKENYSLIPYLIHKGLRVERYIKDLCFEDFLLTEEGSDPDKKSQKDYLSNLITPFKSSKEFKNQLANSKNFFQASDLAFSIVLHERLDIANLLALHPQHTLDILDECVDRQYTEGIAWAFRHGVGELQKNNPLYLRLCIEKADVESTKTIIQSGANIDIPPSSDLSKYGSTSLLEFSIQCYLNYGNDEKNGNSRRYNIIELFLKSGANPNADHGRPLSLCLINHDWELTRLLTNYGADINCEDMISIRMANLFIKRSNKYYTKLKWTKKLRPKSLNGKFKDYIHKSH